MPRRVTLTDRQKGVLAPGELIPTEVVKFIGAQLGLHADDLVDYAAREETRHEHLSELRALYGYRIFSGRGAREPSRRNMREAWRRNR
jgi:TnpA family transposase